MTSESLLSMSSFEPLQVALDKMPTIAYKSELPEGSVFDGYHKDMNLKCMVSVFQTPNGPVKRRIRASISSLLNGLQ